MTEREYALAIRRQCKRIANARQNPGTLSLRNTLIAAMLAIVAETERYTGATLGTARMMKPLLLTATSGADDNQLYDFLDCFIAAIEERYKIGHVDCHDETLPPS